MEPVYSLAETIIHLIWSVSWQVTILAALIWLIDRLSFRATPMFRYWLWMIVLVRLCIPVSIELPTGIDTSFINRLEKNVADFRYRNIPVYETGDEMPSPIEFPARMQLDTIPSADFDARYGPPPMTVAHKIFFVWYAVFIVICIYIAARTLAIIRRLKHCRTVEKPELVSLLDDLSRDMRITRPVKLLYMDKDIGDVPAVVGIFRRGILLPRAIMDTWQTEDIKPILLHELAHIKRMDLLINLLQLIVQAAYFFHPMVWFANRRILQYREEICDDIAVQSLGGRRKHYTMSMVRVMENALREPSLGFVGIGFTERESTVKRRIKRILCDRYKISTRLSVLSIVLLVCIGIAGISVSCARSEVKVIKPPTMELVIKKVEHPDSSAIRFNNTVNQKNKKQLIVEIDKNGNILINGTTISYDSFEAYLAQERYKSGNNTILIRGDVTTRHGDILKLMRMARKQEFEYTATDSKHPETKKIESVRGKIASEGSLKVTEIHLTSTHIKKGTDRVLLNGKPLIRDTDYRIDYTTGTVTILNEEAMDPEADLVIKYEEKKLIAGADPVYISLGWGRQLRPPDELKNSIINLVAAVNRYTDINAKVDTHLFLDSPNIFETPIVFITSDKAFNLTKKERENFGKYLRNGGFAFIDNATPQYEFGQAEASLRQMLKDSLGADGGRTLPIPEDFPLYHCFFDFDDGAPLGAEHVVSQVDKEANEQELIHVRPYIEGIWIDQRFVAIYSDKGYFHRWNDPEHSEPQIKFGVNIVAFALSQKGVMAEEIIGKMK